MGFLDYDAEIRTITCSTNAIESPNAHHRLSRRASQRTLPDRTNCAHVPLPPHPLAGPTGRGQATAGSPDAPMTTATIYAPLSCGGSGTRRSVLTCTPRALPGHGSSSDVTVDLISAAARSARSDRCADAPKPEQERRTAGLASGEHCGRRQVARVRYTPTDRAWLTTLSRLPSRRRWAAVFPVTPATILTWHRRPASAKGTNVRGVGLE